LNQKTKELENSKLEIEGKNIRLSDALSELNNKINELGIVRKQVSYKREEERKRIARELHDDTLARITDLKLHIESIIYSNKMSIEDNKQLGACIPILDSVTREVRRTINALRPSMLDNALGLLPAIENLLDELGKRTNYSVKTKFATSLLKLKLNELHEIHIYRIVQEALNNIYKHANATNVEVVIEEQFGQLLVLVSDNGVGINVERKTNGFGILDMKERAELIGAKLQYINKPSNFGATLELTVPLKQNDLFVLEKKESVAKS
ncbi:MAG: sensor histidine kinase, partial [Candidatus Melainabacteria bacterium]|nr:sensor histidine kinase [Candidatus Melainabacteria bacterium]